LPGAQVHTLIRIKVSVRPGRSMSAADNQMVFKVGIAFA